MIGEAHCLFVGCVSVFVILSVWVKRRWGDGYEHVLGCEMNWVVWWGME